MERLYHQSHDVSGLLRAWGQGDEDAIKHLVPLVYDELRNCAHRHLKAERRSNHTLETTALVHETYLRLTKERAANWENRAQFFWLASETMRRVLVDYARARSRDKRGGDVEIASLQSCPEIRIAAANSAVDLMGLDEALTRLVSLDPQQARIVQLRYFGGCSIEETAEVLEISTTTVKRDWAVAKAWLRRELKTAG
jgi:RNA polymerase sigma factor (TIGR02999 family)